MQNMGMKENLFFLTTGSMLQHLTNGKREERSVCISQDFERLEMMNPTQQSNKRVEAFLLVKNMKSINIKKKGFDIYFKNSDSTTETFFVDQQDQLQQWTNALNAVIYHAKDQGGLARLRHKMKYV
jgi:hypothetical protein